MTTIINMTQEQKDRIAQRLIQNSTENVETGCREWNNYCNKGNGYGQMWVGMSAEGKHLWSHAHRVAYELNKGKVPEGLEVAHICHNPRCCNLDHLVAVTHKENVRMSVDDGRWAAGVEKPNAKLDEATVRTIKQGTLFEHLSINAVARLFDIHTSTLRAILRGATWTHVEA